MRDAYAAEKRRLVRDAETRSDYLDAREPWFDTAYGAAWARARETGWHAT